MKLEIRHKTTYRYDGPVHFGLQQVRLTPKKRENQRVVNWQIEIEGGEKQVAFDDQHNNRVMLVAISPGAEEVVVSAHGSVETTDNAGVLGKHGGFAPLWYFLRETPLTEAGPLVRKLAKSLGKRGADDLSAMHELSAAIREEVAFKTGQTDVTTTAEEALAGKVGVCQDHTHIFVAGARHMGFPARYVSGYLMMNDRVDQDATHAWAEAHIEGLGWVGFDISNGYSPDERYVAVATGLDYLETAPISGMRYGNTDESLIVSLQVQQ